jgi:hypothetical protein
VRATARRVAAATLVLAALACAHPAGPRRSLQEQTPIAPGAARLVIYRTTATDAPSFYPRVQVDDAVVGKLGMGSFVWVDRTPDWHSVGVVRGRFESAFGEQSPARPFAVMLAPGETTYVELQVLVLGTTIQANLRKPDLEAQARALAALRESPPESAD